MILHNTDKVIKAGSTLMIGAIYTVCVLWGVDRGYHQKRIFCTGVGDGDSNTLRRIYGFLFKIHSKKDIQTMKHLNKGFENEWIPNWFKAAGDIGVSSYLYGLICFLFLFLDFFSFIVF